RDERLVTPVFGTEEATQQNGGQADGVAAFSALAARGPHVHLLSARAEEKCSQVQIGGSAGQVFERMARDTGSRGRFNWLRTIGAQTAHVAVTCRSRADTSGKYSEPTREVIQCPVLHCGTRGGLTNGIVEGDVTRALHSQSPASRLHVRLRASQENQQALDPQRRLCGPDAWDSLHVQLGHVTSPLTLFSCPGCRPAARAGRATDVCARICRPTWPPNKGHKAEAVRTGSAVPFSVADDTSRRGAHRDEDDALTTKERVHWGVMMHSEAAECLKEASHQRRYNAYRNTYSQLLSASQPVTAKVSSPESFAVPTAVRFGAGTPTGSHPPAKSEGILEEMSVWSERAALPCVTCRVLGTSRRVNFGKFKTAAQTELRRYLNTTQTDLYEATVLIAESPGPKLPCQNTTPSISTSTQVSARWMGDHTRIPTPLTQSSHLPSDRDVTEARVAAKAGRHFVLARDRRAVATCRERLREWEKGVDGGVTLRRGAC
ncbi:hypothetical protein BaRGS_00032857, partial [Batillaria attramentaria]